MEVSRCGETRESLGDDDRVVAPSPAIRLAERDQFRRGDGTGFGGGEQSRPRLEQVVRRLDAPGTEVALALPIQFPGIGETDANAGDFDLPRDDQRFFGTERAPPLRRDNRRQRRPATQTGATCGRDLVKSPCAVPAIQMPCE